jgi:hypothetical protein
MKIKQGIPEERRLESIRWAFEHFKHVTDKDYFFAIIAHLTIWDISAMLVDEEDNIMGLYLLGDKQLDSLVRDEKYLELNGVEGVLLAVDKSIRGMGWGNKLKDFPKTLGFDYIWGQQLKTLNNLIDWLKRRELVGETNSVYITAEIFK